MKNTTPTFRERLSRIEKTTAFLIGMAVFVATATVVLAVPQIGQYRARAYEAGAIADVTQVARRLKADFDDDQVFPGDAAAVADEFTASGDSLPSTNRAASYTNNGETFVLCVEHNSGAFAEFDSASGVVTRKGRSDGC